MLKRVISLLCVATISMTVFVGCGDKKPSKNKYFEIPTVNKTTMQVEKVEFSQTVEAETGTITDGLSIRTDREGYSGDGYVAGFTSDGKEDWFIEVEVPSNQYYDITIRSAANSYKYNVLMIDGYDQGHFTCQNGGEFNDYLVRGIYLEKGKHTFSISEVWGGCEIDYITIVNSEPLSEDFYTNIDDLVNPNATEKTKRVFEYLKSMYGKRTLSGQYAAHNNLESPEIELIYEVTGKYPAVRGFDFIHSSAGSNYVNKNETSLAIEWSKSGGLVSFSWHWLPPMYEQSYTPGESDWNIKNCYTEIDIANMKRKEIKQLWLDGEINEETYQMICDMDSIAEELKILQENDVVVLWRPLHEASGGWFWWGAEGASYYKWLWQLMFTRYTEYHSLNNLIWVCNAQDVDSKRFENWYVGDEYCDIVGVDLYPAKNSYGAQASEFYEMVKFGNFNKMVTLSECGVMMDPDEIVKDNAYWSWFDVWYGIFVQDEEGNYTDDYTEREMAKKVYNSEIIITRDELPNFDGLTK